jgi:hypothetical protein
MVRSFCASLELLRSKSEFFTHVELVLFMMYTGEKRGSKCVKSG